jgi:hypothetical protein
MKNENERMQDSEFNELSDAAWRRPLTPKEQARLREHLAGKPLARAQWEEEMGLTQALDHLPQVPASSNFTAQVLRAVERERARQGWWQRFDLNAWLPAGLVPRVALGAAMVCVSLLTIREYQEAQRKQMARELASVSRLAALPPMDWLQNFETIDRLNKVKVADVDLLAVLQ